MRRPASVPRHGGARRGAELRRLRRNLRTDTAIGMIFSEIATWFIIFTTGAVLHTYGVTNITSASQAAEALEPLAHTFPYAGCSPRLSLR
ncbi:MAG TPA: divalent metal cation transporter [Ktedonobacterales bacterium]